MCSFSPWQHTRHLRSSLHLRCLCERLSSPVFFSQQTPVLGTGQPAGGLCGELDKHGPRMANISPLCLHGNIWPSVRLPVWLTVSLHTVGVYWCCHGTRNCPPTQVLVYFTKAIYNTKANKQNVTQLLQQNYISEWMVLQLCLHLHRSGSNMLRCRTYQIFKLPFCLWPQFQRPV